MILKLIKFLFNREVVFDDGSYVDWLNREAILYVKEEHTLSINFLFDYDSPIGSHRILYEDELINWDTPDDKEIFSDKERDEILIKIQKYCDKKKINCKFLTR